MIATTIRVNYPNDENELPSPVLWVNRELRIETENIPTKKELIEAMRKYSPRAGELLDEWEWLIVIPKMTERGYALKHLPSGDGSYIFIIDFDILHEYEKKNKIVLAKVL